MADIKGKTGNFNALLTALALFLGLPSTLGGAETSHRAHLNAAGVHLSVLRVNPGSGASTDIRWVSGYAPGVGFWGQKVPASNVAIDYKDGTASVNTTVTTSLGVSLPISVSWTATTSEAIQNITVPNPTRTLAINYKRATPTGTIGALNVAGATGTIETRNIP